MTKDSFEIARETFFELRDTNSTEPHTDTIKERLRAAVRDPTKTDSQAPGGVIEVTFGHELDSK
jgi:hypothetical protein